MRARATIGACPQASSSAASDELASLTAMLGDPQARLVTVTGPGGVGKTRLALAGVRGGRARPGRAASCASTSLRSRTRGWWPRRSRPPPAPDRRAGRRRSTPPRPRCATSARCSCSTTSSTSRAAAADLGALLDACPGVTALVTSRHVLGLSAERTLPLAPLRTPAADGDDVQASAAVALFVGARPGEGPELRAHGRGRRVRGGDLPASGRPAAGDRARRGARGGAEPAGHAGALGRGGRARHRGRARPAVAPADAAQRLRLELRPARARRAGTAAPPGGLRRWLRRRRRSRRPSAATAACSGRWSSSRSPRSPPWSIAACCIARRARRASRASRCS